MSSNYMLKNIFSVKHLANPRKQRTFALANKKHRGVEQLVARQAHNLEVARSSRTPATKKGSSTASFYFFYQFSTASAKASRAGMSASFIEERRVTVGSTMFTFFICSMMARMALPADGAQVPFSTIPTVRFW